MQRQVLGHVFKLLLYCHPSPPPLSPVWGGLNTRRSSNNNQSREKRKDGTHHHQFKNNSIINSSTLTASTTPPTTQGQELQKLQWNIYYYHHQDYYNHQVADMIFIIVEVLYVPSTIILEHEQKTTKITRGRRGTIITRKKGQGVCVYPLGTVWYGNSLGSVIHPSHPHLLCSDLRLPALQRKQQTIKSERHRPILHKTGLKINKVNKVYLAISSPSPVQNRPRLEALLLISSSSVGLASLHFTYSEEEDKNPTLFMTITSLILFKMLFFF